MPRKPAEVTEPEGRVRISSGEFRGRKLDCPQTGGVRPMLNRTRMALFNVLQDALKGAQVWDCFAGSGLLGVEALSRGAKHCVFAELEGFHARTIQANVDALGIRDRTLLIRGSIFDLIKPGSPSLPNTPADLLLLDPPHAMIKQIDDGPFWPWLRRLHESPLAGPGTMAAIGHPAELVIPAMVGAFAVQDARVYGTVAFTIMKHE